MLNQYNTEKEYWQEVSILWRHYWKIAQKSVDSFLALLRQRQIRFRQSEDE